MVNRRLNRINTRIIQPTTIDDLPPEPEPILPLYEIGCRVKGCNKKIEIRKFQLCSIHYGRYVTYGDVNHINPKKIHPEICEVKSCKIDYGCSWYKRESVDRKWYCPLHKHSAKTYGDPLYTTKTKEEQLKLYNTPCSVLTCTSICASKKNGKGKFKDKGLCNTHDNKARRHNGDPLVGQRIFIKEDDICVVASCNVISELYILDKKYCRSHYNKIHYFATQLK